MPDSSNRSLREQQLDVLIAEYLQAGDRGQPLDQVEFLRQHPEFSVELREYFADEGRIHAARGLGPNQASTMAAVGLKIRDYRILEKIGAGGMGTVYLALHMRLEKTVALKILKADRERNPQSIARFEREMKAVGKLEHQHIVRALDAGDEAGTHFLVMEYIAGCDLGRLLQTKGRLEVPLACELIRQAALGLQHAHDHNLVHRDVKPSNLILSGTGQVKVLDLGLAQLEVNADHTDELTRDGQLVGTWLYMAPEQFLPGRQVDSRSDIFSLGVTFYSFLVGELPLNRGQAATQLPQIGTLRPDVPPDLQILLTKMLAPQQDQRIQTMTEVAQILQAYATQGAVNLLANCASRISAANGVSSALAGTQAWSSTADEPEVVPPPVQVSIPVGIPVRIPATRVQPPPRPPWQYLVAGSAITAAVLALGLGIAVLFQRDTTGTLVLRSDDHLILQLVKEDGVYAVDDADSTHKRHRLAIGNNVLPIGDYTLETDARIVKLVKRKISVRANEPCPVRPELELLFPWAYPQIPGHEGASVNYYGTLWHLGLQQPIAYDVTLRALHIDPTLGKQWRWIEISVISKDNAKANASYTETGYLLIDEEHFRLSQRLEIKRGWCIAKSRDLEPIVKQKDPKHELERLVVPFDPGKSLKSVANEMLLVAPGNVLGLHDVLVILFGADCPAADAPLRALREKIAGDTQREFDFEQVPSPGGELTINCFVARSREIEKRGAFPVTTYKICRNDEPGKVPFSFVQMDANVKIDGTSVFNANLRLRGTPNPQGEPVPFQEALVSEQSSQCEKLPPPGATPFDRAVLPPHDPKGATVYYNGTLALGRGPKLHYTARITSLRRQVIEGINHRALEIDVQSGRTLEMTDSREVVRILISEDEYNKPRGKFSIHHGWIECRGETFAFPPSGDLTEVENQLVQLGKPRPYPRVSATDVLTLIFDARLPDSKLINLRDYIKLLRLPGGFQPVPKNVDLALPSGGKVLGEEWVLPPIPIIGASYTLRRSLEVDFNFHSATLTVPKKLEFAAYLAEPNKNGEIPVKDEAELDGLLKKTMADITKTAKENFRVWTWRDEQWDSPRKYFGEFGGRLGDAIVLRDKAGNSRNVPESDLIVADQQFLEKPGRIWRDETGKRFREGNFWLDVSTIDTMKGNFGGVIEDADLVLLIRPDGGETKILRDKLSKEDRTWLDNHPKAAGWPAAKVAIPVQKKLRPRS